MTDQPVRRRAHCNGRDIDYDLGIEMLPLRISSGEEIGTLSAFSYVAQVPPEQRNTRPVVFLTNGGPGASSSFLHLSGIGPLRASVPSDLAAGALPPYGIEDSPSSILDAADLVFIDAPRTGLGSVAPDADLTEVYSIDGDAQVHARAITEWIRRHGRWNSPKYFLGESYGTQRAALLASAVHGFDTVPLSGIALLGQAVNIQETAERPGNVTGALANLPYKAAVAWFHGVGGTEHAHVEDAVDAALEYAWGELALAMLQGTALAPQQLHEVAERLSRMIGIPAEELERSRLWISKKDFRSRLLAEKRLVLGTNDSRYLAPAADAAVGESPLDAATLRLTPAYTAAISILLDEVLGLRDRPSYRGFDEQAVARWEWAEPGSRMFMTMGKPSPFHTYPYPAHLSRWMKAVPESRLFIGTGLYDSLTTVGAADHLVRQWDLPRERVTSRWYAAGHMMYSDPEIGAQLNADLRAFVTGQCS
ncbi:MAG: hypothetical protein QM607_12465 [Microbacterium sp.]